MDIGTKQATREGESAHGVPGSAFTLLDGWDVIVEYRTSIWIFTLVAIAAATTAAFLMTPTYRAEVVVTPAISDALGTGASANPLKGLASLAGVNLTATGDTVQKVAVLRSRALIEEFIQRNNLLPTLYSGTKPRTLWFGVEKFEHSVLAIHEDTRTGLITLGMEWTDAQLAARWANSFVALANEVIRTRDEHTAERNLEFLNRQLVKTNILEMQRVMYNLIESETKTLMLASTRDDYGFVVIDPAVPPERKARPSRALVMALGAVFGFAIGFVVAVIRRARRARSFATAS